MTTTRITAFFLALFASALVSAADNIAVEVERGMRLWNVPGMAVAVVGPDNIDFRGGFGSTALHGGQAVDEHTLFAIASTTKAMVAAGILMLTDEGKLSLDDLVIDHIPELHFNNAALESQLTLRDLLAHRTGLPSTDLWSFVMGLSLDEQIGKLREVELAAAPRSRLIYQNTMFELLGLIIERVSGQRWDVFLAEHLWRPVGMDETYGARGQIPEGKVHALPHNEIDGEMVQVHWDLDAADTHAAGSVWSSVHDMSLWAQFLLRGGVTADGDRLLSERAVEEMFEPQNLSTPEDFYPTVELTAPHWRTYGLGWFQQDFQGRKIEFHTGSLLGLIAIIGLDRANGKAIIALGNRDHAEMRHALLWYAMDASEDVRDWNQDVFDLYVRIREEAEQRDAELNAARLIDTRPGLPLERYTGRFNNEAVGEFVVGLNGGELVLTAGRYTFELTHWHLDTFEMLWADWDLRGFVSFDIGPDGKVGSMSVFGQEYVRVAEDPDQPSD